MSFVIAVLSPYSHDVIFCSEGKELLLWLGETEINEETTELVRDDFIKTLALNAHVCIGFGGKVRSIRAFLEKILPELPWHECTPKDAPTNFVESFAIMNGPDILDVSLAGCRESIIEFLNSSEADCAEGLKPILGGSDGNRPALYSFPRDKGRYQYKHTELAYGVPTDFSPSDDWPTLDNIVHHSVNLHNLRHRAAEELCMEALELVADQAYSCNKNITFRRLSKGFTEEGREIVVRE
ncbi:hypothetical protein ACFLS0_04825 [Candidatus Bipolaricaulota bacterium]